MTVVDARTETDDNTAALNGDPPVDTDRATAAETAAPSDETVDGDVDLEAIVAERDSYLDQLQRSRADFANFKRRVEQERGQLREFAYQGLLVQMLPVLDDLQRALAAASEEREDDPLLKGVRLVEQKFASVLERIGVTPFGASGEPFDPKVHEAVDFDAGSAGDTVVDVYQTGYRLGQSLIRPAMVKVGGKPN